MNNRPGEILRQLLPALSIQARAALEREARLEQYPAGMTLCSEGEIEDSFYIVLEGNLDVYKVREGRRLLINQLPPGSHFGEIALLLDVPRTATVVTAEAVRVLKISRSTIDQLLHRQPEIVLALSQMIIRRLLSQEEKQLTEIARLKKREGPPSRFFLSYARADQPFALRLADRLLKLEIDLWVDVHRMEAGRSWARQVGQALDECRAMLLVLSPASAASENVEDEWNYYLDQKKPVVIARHLACKVPYRLSKLEYIDFDAVDFDAAVARLAATLNTILRRS